MSKSRSVSRPTSGKTISVDSSYAQELVEFWIRKYEQAKEELDQTKGASVSASSSPRSSSCDNDNEREGGPSSATEYEEESEVDALTACNEDLRNKLAVSEQQRLALQEKLQPLLAQNAALALEADVARKQMINAIYPPVTFSSASPSTFRFPSLRVLSERLLAGVPEDYSICFLPRPPACLPLRVTACGQHGYWFSPGAAYTENLEFELVVEGKIDEWTYLGRYRSVYLPSGEMQLSEWLELDDETKGAHCTRVATQELGQDAATPAAISAAADGLRRRYESGQVAVPCSILVCTGFTSQMQTALYLATRVGKRKLDGQAGDNRIKREAR